MSTASISMKNFPPLDSGRMPSVTDQIFSLLYDRVVNLTLPPGAKLSEVEVAAQAVARVAEIPRLSWSEAVTEPAPRLT